MHRVSFGIGVGLSGSIARGGLFRRRASHSLRRPFVGGWRGRGGTRREVDVVLLSEDRVPDGNSLRLLPLRAFKEQIHVKIQPARMDRKARFSRNVRELRTSN